MLACMPNPPDSPDRPAPAASPATVTPSEIAQSGARHLAISWADGLKSLFDVRELRLACACANCVDEWTGERVGRYAIQIDWSDGHDTGIYAFDRLRAIAETLETEPLPN